MTSLSLNKPHLLLLPGSSGLTPPQHTLISKNHKEHDIFFTTGGKHNHLIHHYLAAYSLGASMEKLESIYEGHASFLRPITDAEDITEETYRERLGDGDGYGSYLKFFKDEIDKRGMLDTIRYWMFKDDMLARVLAGGYHALIHIGYAVEFDLPSIAAEGLAMAACTEDVLVPVIDLTEESIQRKRYNGTSSIQVLAKEIKIEPAFDGIVDVNKFDKLAMVLKNEVSLAKLREYLADWKFKEPESALQELFTSCALIYAASGIREQGIKLDFFLMHALTSTYALYTLLPHLNQVQAELMLRGHFAATLGYYIARGRPTLRVDLLTQYKPPHKPKGENPWLDIISRALDVEECHVSKVIRSLALGQVTYRNSSEEIWIKAAQITLDVIGPTSESHIKANWNFIGVGFDEAWKE